VDPTGVGLAKRFCAGFFAKIFLCCHKLFLTSE
jgi:hypothetical protein